MLSQISDEKIIQNNLQSLTSKKTFLSNRDMFGKFLQSNRDFRYFCFKHKPTLNCESMIVVSTKEIESFANLVYHYCLQFRGASKETHTIKIFAKSYSSFTKGDPSYVFQESQKSRSAHEAGAFVELENLKIDQLAVPHVILNDSDLEILITLGLKKSEKAISLDPSTDLNCEHLCAVCNVLARLHSRTYSPYSTVIGCDTAVMASMLFFRGTLARKLAQEILALQPPGKHL